MERKKYFFEHSEFIVSVVFTIVAAGDIAVIFFKSTHDPEKHARWEITHEILQSLFLLSVVVLSILILIRWYRHTHEMHEAFKVAKDLFQEGDRASETLRDIIDNCSEIRRKRWPEFAELFLVERLLEIKSITNKMKSGSMEIELNFGQRHSPHFFTITKGPSFVTATGNGRYWHTEPGKRQLEANKRAIESNNGDITRVIILGEKNGSSAIEYPDDIIENQLAAKIKLLVICESKVEDLFRCDVGVFFDDRGQNVAFLSEWPYPDQPQGRDQPRGRAKLTFEGERLAFGNRVYEYFINHEEACTIHDFKDWQQYKDNPTNGA